MPLHPVDAEASRPSSSDRLSRLHGEIRNILADKPWPKANALTVVIPAQADITVRWTTKPKFRTSRGEVSGSYLAIGFYRGVTLIGCAHGAIWKLDDGFVHDSNLFWALDAEDEWYADENVCSSLLRHFSQEDAFGPDAENRFAFIADVAFATGLQPGLWAHVLNGCAERLCERLNARMVLHRIRNPRILDELRERVERERGDAENVTPEESVRFDRMIARGAKALTKFARWSVFKEAAPGTGAYYYSPVGSVKPGPRAFNPYG